MVYVVATILWLIGLSTSSWVGMLILGNLHAVNTALPAIGFAGVFGALFWPSFIMFMIWMVYATISVVLE